MADAEIAATIRRREKDALAQHREKVMERAQHLQEHGIYLSRLDQMQRQLEMLLNPPNPGFFRRAWNYVSSWFRASPPDAWYTRPPWFSAIPRPPPHPQWGPDVPPKGSYDTHVVVQPTQHPSDMLRAPFPGFDFQVEHRTKPYDPQCIAKFFNVEELPPERKCTACKVVSSTLTVGMVAAAIAYYYSIIPGV